MLTNTETGSPFRGHFKFCNFSLDNTSLYEPNLMSFYLNNRNTLEFLLYRNPKTIVQCYNRYPEVSLFSLGKYSGMGQRRRALSLVLISFNVIALLLLIIAGKALKFNCFCKMFFLQL